MERESFLSLLFGWLFDFSFTRFLTSKIVRFLYGVSLSLTGLLALLWIVIGFSFSVEAGILFLFLASVFFLFSVALDRIFFEIIIVVFRIAELLAEIARQGRKSDSSVSGG